jgi:hypothetical protein
MIPAMAAWKRVVVDSLNRVEPQGMRHDFGDDAQTLFSAFTGEDALRRVRLEIAWVSGDTDSEKVGRLTPETLDAYAGEIDGVAS